MQSFFNSKELNVHRMWRTWCTITATQYTAICCRRSIEKKLKPYRNICKTIPLWCHIPYPILIKGWKHISAPADPFCKPPALGIQIKNTLQSSLSILVMVYSTWSLQVTCFVNKQSKHFPGIIAVHVQSHGWMSYDAFVCHFACLHFFAERSGLCFWGLVWMWNLSKLNLLASPI